MKDPRKGEGTIFRAASEPVPLSEQVLDGLVGRQSDSTDESAALLTQLESQVLSVIEQHASSKPRKSGCSTVQLAGVDSCHHFFLPDDRPAKLSDAIQMLGCLCDLSIEIARQNPRLGRVIAAAVTLGEWRAAMGTRQFERPAKIGIGSINRFAGTNQMKNRQDEAEEIAKQFIAANPNCSAGNVRSHVQRELGIRKSQGYDYLPKATLSKLLK